MKNKKLFYEIIIILLCACIVTGSLIVRNNIQRNRLRKEIHGIANIDLGKYTFDDKIKCRGSFGIVEKTIKLYISDYNKTFQDVNNIMNDNTLISILSLDNYKNDAPEFKTSKEYLANTEKKYTETINNLIKNSDKDYINNYIYKNTKDKYFIKLYQEIIKDEGIDEKTIKYKDELIKHKDNSLNTFKCINGVIDLLVNNKGKWKIEDNTIKFDTRDLLNQYNEYINNMKKN